MEHGTVVKPFHPPRFFIFPKEEELIIVNIANWFNRFEFLHYDVSMQRHCFCHTCIHAACAAEGDKV